MNQILWEGDARMWAPEKWPPMQAYKQIRHRIVLARGELASQCVSLEVSLRNDAMGNPVWEKRSTGDVPLEFFQAMARAGGSA